MQTFDDLDIAELSRDPYPAFDQIRALGSVVHVPAANIALVTRFDDVVNVEDDPATFASSNPGSLMHVFMGHSLMRKDFEEHANERRALDPSFKPSVARDHWAPLFREIAAELIDGFVNDGKADLFNAFAAPMASKSLIAMLGFKGVAWDDLAAWSQSMMDGIANYHGDPDITARGLAASASVEDAIDAVLDVHRANQNPTILSSMAHAACPHALAQIQSNTKVIIGGGLNEPRDAILTTVQALLQNPDQRAQAKATPKLYGRAFDEAIRWVAPIGMYPRRVMQDTKLGDTDIPADTQIGICVGAANRDPRHFDNPHSFDINRSNKKHLAFGRGPHFCAGTWISRQMIGEIAVPMLFERLKNLRLDPATRPEMRGWVFRGPTSMPVIWDA